VGGVDASRIVDGIGIDAPAPECVLDPGSLGKAKVPSFDHYAHAQLGGRDAAQIVGVVAHLFATFITRTHDRADAAVGPHAGECLQNRAYQALAIKGIVIAPKRATRRATQLDALLAAARHPATATDKRGIVVGPL